ncbi:MAG: protein arginine N-methyltransferase [Burkholderiales bacterium]
MLSELFKSLKRASAQQQKRRTDLLIDRAKTLHSESRFQEAIDCFEEIVAIAPESSASLYGYALCLAELGRKADAARILLRAVDLRADIPNIGVSIMNLFDTMSSAEAGAKQEDVVGWFARASDAMSRADYSAAKRFLELVLRDRPGFGLAQQRLGCIAALEGARDQADAYFKASGAQGIPPDGFIRLAPDFLASMDAGGIPALSQELIPTDDAQAVIFAACDSVYFRRFAYPLLNSLRLRSATRLRVHLHVFNPDPWIEDEIATLPINGSLVSLEMTSETRQFASADEAKTFYSCARLYQVPALLTRHRLPVIMMDMDVLALQPLAALIALAERHDVAVLQWPGPRWRIWDTIYASTVVFRPTVGGLRFATMVENYVRSFISRPSGAWYLDQIALFAAYTHLRDAGVSFGMIPSAWYSLYLRDGEAASADAVFWSVTANIPASRDAMAGRLFRTYLPETRRAFGWTLPGTDRFFVDVLSGVPEESGRKRWDLAVMQFCENHFGSRRRRALDIGAHVGFWSEWLARRFDHVDAFEPHLLMRACFRSNVRFPNVVLHECGLGEREMRVAMTFDEEKSGMTHIDPGKSGDIEIRALDNFTFDSVDFVKIDTEGFEALVLRGGAETLRRNRPLLLVNNIEHYQTERYGTLAGEVKRLLESLGASLVARSSDANELYAWTD